MHLRLNKLTIENFAGIKEQSFEFNGHNSKIYGANGTGKTTTATALQWLLFDKGLDGSTKSFNPVPLNANNQEQYELVPTVEAEFTIGDHTLLLRKESRPKYTTNQKTNRKEYSRSRTKRQYINEEPVKISDYKSRIKDVIDEDVFKLITNPAAFNNLDWKKRREILFEIADPINNEDIINSNHELKGLSDLLNEHDIETKKKIVSDKIKQINKEIQDIPTRINQESKGLQEVEPLNDSELKQIESEIEVLKQQRIEVRNGSKSIELKIEAIKQEQQNIQESIAATVLMIDEQINDLYAKKSKFDERLIIIESNKRSEQRIKELRTKEDNLLEEKEEYAYQLYQLNLFTTTKINILTDNINEKFDMAEFKLFNQLVNGELEETCITLVDGVEYSGGLNNAARINVGLDIINTLCKHYNVTAPIFIDNAESVTNVINTEAQQIQLIVSEDNRGLVMKC
ncbi:AAA family ATPase [Staphylococcus pseudintermedius]|nr:AAA family ATPase [Staphylococcus pseudintermedius]